MTRRGGPHERDAVYSVCRYRCPPAQTSGAPSRTGMLCRSEAQRFIADAVVSDARATRARIAPPDRGYRLAEDLQRLPNPTPASSMSTMKAFNMNLPTTQTLDEGPAPFG